MKKPVIIAIIAIVIVAIIVAIIVGISLNKPNNEKDGNKQQEITDAESFRNVMQEKGYIVMDAKNQFANYSKIEKVYIATNESYSYQIEFYQISDDAYATSFYNNNKSKFEALKTENSVETNNDLENHSKYTLTTDDKYKAVSKVNNNIIYLDVKTEYKDTVQKILEELGF
ncbi:MAG: hypothetical protein HFJ18_01110 [Clostridia bacterium]|nr:hypothetical protein [Clostridia bacterium]